MTLASVGFVTAMVFNGIAISMGANYGSALTATAAHLVVTWDLGVVAIAAAVFIVIEGRRIGMRRSWLFVLLACVTAIACAFPLFLAMRERHLAHQTTSTPTP